MTPTLVVLETMTAEVRETWRKWGKVELEQRITNLVITFRACGYNLSLDSLSYLDSDLDTRIHKIPSLVPPYISNSGTVRRILFT